VDLAGAVDDRVVVISTNVSVSTRSINVLLHTGVTERFALAQATNGDVFWRHDEFVLGEEGPEWTGHVGRLTVGEVVARVPTCERQVVAWTREEVESGPDEPGFDIFRRDQRRRALERLTGELAALSLAA
jgi:hypothetical protein